MTHRASGVILAPTVWAVPQPGTNGYVSSWGAMLSGTTPIVALALPRPPAGFLVA
ncbi:hypothetical protein [Leucobacter aridicollis]|uniref:hypothetical protein n=1 Tax=Leucobacter aridicollis TaxID=283878 RepID=UPI00210219A3|nr:hypothetical protein [Leucobacter aridicollis]UTX53795.1 hypothetical protein KI794_03405 [Leucobacter aridicollis]